MIIKFMLRFLTSKNQDSDSIIESLSLEKKKDLIQVLNRIKSIESANKELFITRDLETKLAQNFWLKKKNIVTNFDDDFDGVIEESFGDSDTGVTAEIKVFDTIHMSDARKFIHNVAIPSE